jgi:hypothetical protein
VPANVIIRCPPQHPLCFSFCVQHTRLKLHPPALLMSQGVATCSRITLISMSLVHLFTLYVTGASFYSLCHLWTISFSKPLPCPTLIVFLAVQSLNIKTLMLNKKALQVLSCPPPCFESLLPI